uniref:Uncharacterized protein n=1 Tax=Knipowitschia caucasica TaxID=637954 RepID=A0AAV2KZH3_KNICA
MRTLTLLRGVRRRRRSECEEEEGSVRRRRGSECEEEEEVRVCGGGGGQSVRRRRRSECEEEEEVRV